MWIKIQCYNCSCYDEIDVDDPTKVSDSWVCDPCHREMIEADEEDACLAYERAQASKYGYDQ